MKLVFRQNFSHLAFCVRTTRKEEEGTSIPNEEEHLSPKRMNQDTQRRDGDDISPKPPQHDAELHPTSNRKPPVPTEGGKQAAPAKRSDFYKVIGLDIYDPKHPFQYAAPMSHSRFFTKAPPSAHTPPAAFILAVNVDVRPGTSDVNAATVKGLLQCLTERRAAVVPAVPSTEADSVKRHVDPNHSSGAPPAASSSTSAASVLPPSPPSPSPSTVATATTSRTVATPPPPLPQQLHPNVVRFYDILPAGSEPMLKYAILIMEAPAGGHLNRKDFVARWLQDHSSLTPIARHFAAEHEVARIIRQIVDVLAWYEACGVEPCAFNPEVSLLFSRQQHSPKSMATASAPAPVSRGAQTPLGRLPSPGGEGIANAAAGGSRTLPSWSLKWLPNCWLHPIIQATHRGEASPGRNSFTSPTLQEKLRSYRELQPTTEQQQQAGSRRSRTSVRGGRGRSRADSMSRGSCSMGGAAHDGSVTSWLFDAPKAALRAALWSVAYTMRRLSDDLGVLRSAWSSEAVHFAAWLEGATVCEVRASLQQDEQDVMATKLTSDEGASEIRNVTGASTFATPSAVATVLSHCYLSAPP